MTLWMSNHVTRNSTRDDQLRPGGAATQVWWLMILSLLATWELCVMCLWSSVLLFFHPRCTITVLSTTVLSRIEAYSAGGHEVWRWAWVRCFLLIGCRAHSDLQLKVWSLNWHHHFSISSLILRILKHLMFTLKDYSYEVIFIASRPIWFF